MHLSLGKKVVYFNAFKLNETREQYFFYFFNVQEPKIFEASTCFQFFFVNQRHFNQLFVSYPAYHSLLIHQVQTQV